MSRRIPKRRLLSNRRLTADSKPIPWTDKWSAIGTTVAAIIGSVTFVVITLQAHFAQNALEDKVASEANVSKDLQSRITNQIEDLSKITDAKVGLINELSIRRTEILKERMDLQQLRMDDTTTKRQLSDKKTQIDSATKNLQLLESQVETANGQLAATAEKSVALQQRIQKATDREILTLFRRMLNQEPPKFASRLGVRYRVSASAGSGIRDALLYGLGTGALPTAASRFWIQGLEEVDFERPLQRGRVAEGDEVNSQDVERVQAERYLGVGSFGERTTSDPEATALMNEHHNELEGCVFANTRGAICNVFFVAANSDPRHIYFRLLAKLVLEKLAQNKNGDLHVGNGGDQIRADDEDDEVSLAQNIPEYSEPDTAYIPESWPMNSPYVLEALSNGLKIIRYPAQGEVDNPLSVEEVQNVLHISDLLEAASDQTSSERKLVMTSNSDGIRMPNTDRLPMYCRWDDLLLDEGIFDTPQLQDLENTKSQVLKSMEIDEGSSSAAISELKRKYGGDWLMVEQQMARNRNRLHEEVESMAKYGYPASLVISLLRRKRALTECYVDVATAYGIVDKSLK